MPTLVGSRSDNLGNVLDNNNAFLNASQAKYGAMENLYASGLDSGTQNGMKIVSDIEKDAMKSQFAHTALSGGTEAGAQVQAQSAANAIANTGASIAANSTQNQMNAINTGMQDYWNATKAQNDMEKTKYQEDQATKRAKIQAAAGFASALASGGAQVGAAALGKK